MNEQHNHDNGNSKMENGNGILVTATPHRVSLREPSSPARGEGTTTTTTKWKTALRDSAHVASLTQNDSVTTTAKLYQFLDCHGRQSALAMTTTATTNWKTTTAFKYPQNLRSKFPLFNQKGNDGVIPNPQYPQKSLFGVLTYYQGLA
jgi:hypothetical protein